MDVTVYNGTNPSGKNIAVFAGVHGNEVTPVYALMKIVKESQFSDLDIFNKINKLTVINGINDIGLLNNERDHKKPHTHDLNRTFIDSEIDVISELKTFLLDTDILIDVHSSPNCSEFVLIDYNEKTNFYIDWCKKADVDFGVRYSNGNTLKKFIQDRGGMAVTLEVDKMEKINHESATNAIKAIKNLLNTCLSIEPYESKPEGWPIYQYHTYKSGIVDYLVEPGDILSEGTIIAYVLDLKGNAIEEVVSKFAGKVLLVGRDYINVAESLCIVQDENSWERPVE